MPEISAANAKSIFRINKWLGLNENQDGDTNLKNGELSYMRNFRITADNHLQIRPGSKTVCNLQEAWAAQYPDNAAEAATKTLGGLWYGYVLGVKRFLAAFGGAVWLIDPKSWETTFLGELTEDKTTFFGFGQKVYILNGHEYMSWDGDPANQIAEVEGYVPTVATATPPTGGGTLLQNINLLTGKRRQEFSPDGTAKEFVLAEAGVAEIVSVTGSLISYTLESDENSSKVVFESAPGKGVNTLAIVYRVEETERSRIEKMRYSETFSGTTDNRVFLYGDGSAITLYSDLDTDGVATAEYFPDLNEIQVGSANEPITSLCRHYGRMLAFKEGSTYSVQYGTIDLLSTRTIAAFYCTPINRELGNVAPGQVKLVENNPITVDYNNIYMWKSTSSSGNITSDERSAQRLSDRIKSVLSTFDTEALQCFNSKDSNEHFFFGGGNALVFNYGTNTWYRYTEFPAARMTDIEDQVYFCTADGLVKHFSRNYRNDDTEEITARAETGAMDFDRDWMRKYSSLVWIAIKPESAARVTVTVETNKKSSYPQKVVASSLATMTNVNFAHFSFGTNRKPQVKRVKLKVKKATYYKLIFESVSASATATILAADIEVRYTGKVK